MNNEHVLIGMSGGVDSTTAGMLLRNEGCACMGVTMVLWEQEEDAGAGKQCGTDAAVNDAREAARTLGIPYRTVDFREEFRRQVVDRFVRSYEEGSTPNPCVLCNRFLKFGALADWGRKQGYDAAATGHYARRQYDAGSGRWLLVKARDESKDQTYFLAGLNQRQLNAARFPLGGLTKAEVRELAREHGLRAAVRQDSQDICFVPDGDYAAFLGRYTGKTYPAGSFLDPDGHIIGTHRGTVCYTIGQRRGLGLAMGAPVYVCAKDTERNTVTVGPNEALYSRGLEAGDWNWFPFETLTEPLKVTAKIRHSRTECEAEVFPAEGGRAVVRFREPQRAVCPGQAVVLYQGELVIGGGTIQRALP